MTHSSDPPDGTGDQSGHGMFFDCPRGGGDGPAEVSTAEWHSTAAMNLPSTGLAPRYKPPLTIEIENKTSHPLDAVKGRVQAIRQTSGSQGRQSGLTNTSFELHEESRDNLSPLPSWSASPTIKSRNPLRSEDQGEDEESDVFVTPCQSPTYSGGVMASPTTSQRPEQEMLPRLNAEEPHERAPLHRHLSEPSMSKLASPPSPSRNKQPVSPILPCLHPHVKKTRSFPEVKILSDFATGDVVHSQYDDWLVPRTEVSIIKKVREDEYGTMYFGMWRGTKAAVRVLRVRIGSDLSLEGAKKMLSEMSSSFRHPNLALHMGSCTVESCEQDIMIISEYLPKGQIFGSLKSGGDGVLQVATWMLEMFKALSFLHTATPPFIFRNLNPERLMLNADDHLKLADVEVILALRKRGLDDECGSWEKDDAMSFYVAPEVQDGAAMISEKADVFSAGVLCLMMIRGTHPSKNEVAELSSPLVPRRMEWLGRDRERDAIFSFIRECMHRDPEKRPVSVDCVQKLEVIRTVLLARRDKKECRVM